MIRYEGFVTIDGREFLDGTEPKGLPPGVYVPASVWKPGVKLPPNTKLSAVPGLIQQGAAIAGFSAALHAKPEEKRKFWECSVADELLSVNGTKTGRAVLEELRTLGAQVEIKPARDLTSSGALGDGKAQCQPKDDGRMRFSPGVMSYTAGIGLTWIGAPPYRADEVLLHELFHKARQAAGKACVLKTFNEWDNREEFYAILVTNICRSERGSALLRGSHRPRFEMLQDDAATVAQRHNIDLFVLKEDMPVLWKKLAAVPGRFNPVREWVRQEELTKVA